jgi:hypothetical protein
MTNSVFQIKRARKTAAGVGSVVANPFYTCRVAVCVVFSFFAGCFLMDSRVDAGCGSEHVASARSATISNNKLLQLSMKIEYVGGELTWTTSIPNKACSGPGCKANKGFHSEQSVFSSVRGLTFACSNGFGGLLNRFDHSEVFEGWELPGDRDPGHLFHIEHPPRV